jgi:hypothetical protein
MFLKLKQESSGYHPGFKVRKTSTGTLRSTGAQGELLLTRQRTLAKIKLNPMWGKWAQNQNNAPTTIVNSEKELCELLTSAGTEVTNLIFPNN